MKQLPSVSIDDLISILQSSLPSNEVITITEANDQDNTIIFSWRSHSYVMSTYAFHNREIREPRVAVGKVTSERFSEDNSHILLEIMVNRSFQLLRNEGHVMAAGG